MPKHRPPREIWRVLRRRVWERDGGYCQGPYCAGEPPLPLSECHIDHIRSGKLADNSLANLRVLCPRCHALRLDRRHRGLISRALRKGLIPADYRPYLWDDYHWPPAATVAALRRWVAHPH